MRLSKTLCMPLLAGSTLLAPNALMAMGGPNGLANSRTNRCD